MGKYTVPENIRKMKPKGTIVKFIHNKYYVYEHFNKKDSDGKWNTKSGKLLGYINPNKGFIPNTNFIMSEDITTLEYGQYAVVLNNSKNTLNKLLNHFNTKDAYTIYLTAVIHIVNGFTPLKDIEEYTKQSYISLMHTDIKFSYHCLSSLLDALGRKQTKVHQFEQSLINECSKQIAIDGHDIKSCSHENNLAEVGNKYSSMKDMQMNVLMAYDINTFTPLVSRTYPGSILDKTSVKDLLEFHTYHNVLFIIDRGFYSKENIEAFSSNDNHYIIPLSPNLTICKRVTKDMNFHNIFIYEKDKKTTPIEYKEIKVDNKTKIIVCRDLTQNATDKASYLKNIDLDPEKYSMEKYEEMKDLFGVIVLQTNLNVEAKEVYHLYKKRWTIETFFNYFKNRIDINALGLSDYYATQGMSFIMLIVGLIYHDLREKVKLLGNTSIDDCLLKSRFIKLNKKGTCWCVSNAKKNLQDMMKALNVDLYNPLDM